MQVRRTGGAIAAVAGLVAIAATIAALTSVSNQRGEREAAARQRVESQRAHDDKIQAARAALEREATMAAAVPQLQSALRQHVDAATILDILDNEAEFAAWRRYQVALDPGEGELVLRPRGFTADQTVLASAADRGAASNLLDGPVPLLTAAARMAPAGAGRRPPTLVLARPAPELAFTPASPGSTDDRGRAGTATLLGALAGLSFLIAVVTALRRPPPAVISTPTIDAVPASLAAATTQKPAWRRSGPHDATAIAPSQACRSFGRYTLLDRLGEGGMSEIHTAALTGPEGFERIFVLKRLKPGLAHNRDAVAQFIDEARLGSQLVHPNIVPVFDFGKAEDGYYLTQEYIVGRNLAQILERHIERLGTPPELALTCHVAHETLQGLAYAHAKTDADGRPLRIVHRDVSTTNIMATQTGDIRLIDFGIVKAEGRVSQTSLGSVKGNASFMSPEQARGLEVDPRSDLFSLGLVMFTCLTCQQLYTGQTIGEVCYRAASGPTPADRARILALPAPANAILAKALAADPAARYQDAAEFARALAPHTAGAKAQLAELVQALFGDELDPALARRAKLGAANPAT